MALVLLQEGRTTISAFSVIKEGEAALEVR